ncbi:SMI1/KNR4 family protein [Brevundimonas sp. FT23042]|uniref:SMI1/KNR4 family protein n=1 Tax=Brevundimonas sp. FT23042 TaxID=3393749 RepID=UPI003B585DA8
MTTTAIDAALALIADHPDQAFFLGPRSDALIAKAEQALGGRFPPAYRRFVEHLGAGDCDGVEVYGLVDETFGGPLPDAVWITLDERKKGSIPSDLIVVGDSGDGSYYCIQHGEDGPVHLVAPNGRSDAVAADFGAYLLSRLDQ